MKVYNFGSINIDEVYRVEDIVRPGETISSIGYYATLGGKGLNQSVALARSNSKVAHVGIINSKDKFIKDFLQAEGIDTEFIVESDEETGKAIIQVSSVGENSIVLSQGANHKFTKEMINQVFESIEQPAIILSQNETNNVDYMFKMAKKNNHKTILNMAPINKASKDIDLNNIDYLIVNEIEGEGLIGESDPEIMLDKFIKAYPRLNIVLTLGEKGVMYRSATENYKVAALKTDVVDTTGAGDTFVGYFINGLLEKSMPDCLKFANTASSIAIGVLGASDSIPKKGDVEKKLYDQ